MVASGWGVGTVESCTQPDEALTRRYRESGAHTDCYFTELARPVTQAEFVEAFYTTRLFRLERWILRLCVARPGFTSVRPSFARPRYMQGYCASTRSIRACCSGRLRAASR